MTGPAYQPNDEAILGISEICYLFCVSRSQLYEWRHHHDFPAARKTKHGFIGYRIGDLSAWISHNQSWLRNHQAPDVAAWANRLPTELPRAASACETLAM